MTRISHPSWSDVQTESQAISALRHCRTATELIEYMRRNYGTELPRERAQELMNRRR